MKAKGKCFAEGKAAAKRDTLWYGKCPKRPIPLLHFRVRTFTTVFHPVDRDCREVLMTMIESFDTH